MKNKSILVIIGIILFIVLGICFFLKSEEETQNQDTNFDVPSTTTSPVSTTDETEPELVFDEPTTENPADQGNVRKQPAYLWSATVNNVGEQTIGVDYVIVFDGEEAIQAQLEDEVCTEESECEAGQYIRNNNPHHRNFKMSTTTPVTIEVNGAIKNALENDTSEPVTLTFDELQTVLPTLSAFATTSGIAFKEPKTFVYLDIINGAVTSIIEP